MCVKIMVNNLQGVFFLYNKDEIMEYLEKNLNNRRFTHCLGVMDTAVVLAKKYGADVEKAELAGLIHDCAKNLKAKEMLETAKKYKISIDEVLESQPSLLHGPVGAFFCAEKFNIHDEDIFDAVYFHTMGKANMPLLTKIIYIADYIEPSRDFPGVDDIRKTALKDLDGALLQSFDSTIHFTIDKGQVLHCQTINARNYLITKIK